MLCYHYSYYHYYHHYYNNYLGIALEMFHNRELSIPRIEDDFKLGTGATSQSLIPSRPMDESDYTTDMSRSSLYGMYRWMCVCMDVCMYVWMHGWMHGWMYVWMYVCMYVWIDAWMDGWGWMIYEYLMDLN